MTPPAGTTGRRWPRIARALYRKSGTDTVVIPSTGWFVLMAFVAAMHALALWIVVPDAFERAEMRRTWPRGEATVTAVTREWSAKGGPYFELRLRAVLPNGDIVLGHTIPRYGHPLRRSWSEPRRRPEPGDTLNVVMDPGDRRRMATLASVGSPWPSLVWSAFLFTMLAFTVLMITAGIHIRRHARADGSSPPTDQ